MGPSNVSLIRESNNKEDGLIYYLNGEKVASYDAFGCLTVGDTVNTYTTDGESYGSFGSVKVNRVNLFNVFIPTSATAAEVRAVETLREMISEAEYRKYVVHGFILTKGRSGCVYQIFRNEDHTKVWKRGLLIKEVCFRINDPEIPPTDNVIAHKIIIETSEEEFERLGNVYKMAKAA